MGAAWIPHPPTHPPTLPQSKADAFDASQYSFFDFGPGPAAAPAGAPPPSALEGGLEDGVDAPPEEEAPPPDADEEVIITNDDDEDEDLSYAAMFAAGLDFATADGGGSDLWGGGAFAGAYSGGGPDLASLGALAPAAAPLGMQQAPVAAAPGGYGAPPRFAPPPQGAATSASDLEASLLRPPPPPLPAYGAPTSAAELEAELLAGAGGGGGGPRPPPPSYAAAAAPRGPPLARPPFPGPSPPSRGRGYPRGPPPFPGPPPPRGWPPGPPRPGWGPPRPPFPGGRGPPQPSFGRGFAGVRGGAGPRPMHGGGGGGGGHHHHHSPRGSVLMSPDEIDAILRIQWRSLHTGPRYVEDFYAQAVVEKGGRGVNARTFAPDALRELAPAEKGVADLPSFARLDGLGKIPFSNVRRPKPLMDLGFGGAAPAPAPAPAGDDANGNASTPAPTKRLDQEPRLAARVVVEEAACLLLDVDDIDRLWASSGGARSDEGSLRQRRAILMEALCRSLRLADAPTCDRVRDGVFLRLMALHKGRAVLARGLRLLAAPLAAPGPGAAGIKASRPLKLVWAALRCADDLFAERDVGEEEGGGATPADARAAADAAREAHVTAVAAASATDALRRLRSPEEARDCAAALARGSLAARARSAETPADALLPLLPPGAGTPAAIPRPWLADAVIALFTRAGELGLGPGGGAPVGDGPLPPPPSDAVRAAWEAAAGEFATLLAGHVGTLADVAALAREAGSADAVAYARAVAPTHVVAAVLPHAGDVAAATLRRRLAELQEGG